MGNQIIVFGPRKISRAGKGLGIIYVPKRYASKLIGKVVTVYLELPDEKGDNTT